MHTATFGRGVHSRLVKAGPTVVTEIAIDNDTSLPAQLTLFNTRTEPDIWEDRPLSTHRVERHSTRTIPLGEGGRVMGLGLAYRMTVEAGPDDVHTVPPKGATVRVTYI